MRIPSIHTAVQCIVVNYVVKNPAFNYSNTTVYIITDFYFISSYQKYVRWKNIQLGIPIQYSNNNLITVWLCLQIDEVSYNTNCSCIPHGGTRNHQTKSPHHTSTRYLIRSKFEPLIETLTLYRSVFRSRSQVFRAVDFRCSDTIETETLHTLYCS